MTEPVKINPVLAKSQFKDDLKRVQEHKHCRYYDWNFTPEFDDLSLYVDLWSFDQQHTKLDNFHIVMDMSYYRRWPPGVTFVNPETKLFDPNKDLYWFPTMTYAPKGTNIKYHPIYTKFSFGVRQMICNSMILEYYQSFHNPSLDEQWDSTKHNLFSTMSVIQLMLTKPYYGGRLG